jgi:hypothetical protein
MNQSCGALKELDTLKETKELLGDVGDRNDGPSVWKLIMTAMGSPGHDDRIWSAGQVEIVYNQVI